MAIRNRLLSLVLGVLTGCGGGGESYEPPEIDPATIGSEAIRQYDANQDGLLNTKELASCPALLDALDKYDADGDKGISADEIANRMQEMLESQVGYMDCTCEVHFRGRPLPDAVVRLTPESFMGDLIDPAKGTTMGRGAVAYISHEVGPGGVRFGLYRVSITHPSTQIPKKYNEATTLGWEVSPYDRGGDTRLFELN